MAKKGRPKSAGFWVRRLVFLLVGVDTWRLRFTGCEWGTGRAHEGRDQAQPHADTGGEQSGSSLADQFSVSTLPLGSLDFSTCSPLPILPRGCSWDIAVVKRQLHV